MIINSLCNSCLQPYTILVQSSDVHLLKQIADEAGHTCPCPRLCGGAINLIGDPIIDQMSEDRRLKDPINLTAKELYQAVGGMGLPDEVPKDLSVIRALLQASPVKNAMLEEVNGKFYLHELHLQDGVVIHLCSGGRGAQVLKITKTKERADGVSSGA
jgi:hypothetical protein